MDGRTVWALPSEANWNGWSFVPVGNGLGDDGNVGDAGDAEGVDDGAEGAEGHGFVGAEIDDIVLALGLFADFIGELVDVDGVVAEVDELLFIDGDDELLLGNFLDGVGLGDVDLDAGLEDRGGDHKDDQKDEDHVDERNHVDFGEGSLRGFGDLWHGGSRSGEGFFDLGGEFDGEDVEALGEVANVLKEIVIGDEGGDGGEKSCGRGDQRLGDTGRDGAEAGGAGSTETGEGVDDAPYGAEEADKGSNTRSGGEPRHTLFDAANLVGGCQLHADGNGLEGLELGGIGIALAGVGHLGLQFTIAGGVDVGEG